MTNSSKYGGEFCSPDEKQITVFGTGYMANFLTGGAVESVGATLTNKRIYFSGSVFTFDAGGDLASTKERKIVNIRDVTGVGYRLYDPLKYIIYAVLLYSDILAVEIIKRRSKKVMYVALFLCGILTFAYNANVPTAILTVFAIIISAFAFMYLLSTQHFVEITSMQGTYRIAVDGNDSQVKNTVAELQNMLSRGQFS
ncbi:MAG: hypothetical protein FWB80_01670 [Defluviitaleaceae bacterium]|nr:hypothetical protein [Defluviitaleaceae bacterium]